MIRITDTIMLDPDELEFRYVRASGPGGQHVNKVATAVQLRFDVAGSPSLPGGVKTRLLALAGRRATDDGVLMLDARRERSQERNRQDVIDRLVQMIRKAAVRPRKRRPTRPTAASRRKRLDDKRRRGALKRSRGRRTDADD